MAYFKISEPNQPIKYVATVDDANGKLTFSTTRQGSYCRSGGIIADSERDRLEFLFKSEYPELKYLTVDTTY
jgi:hypothetical protein